MRGLEFHLTGLWLADATTVPYYGRVADPLAGEVVIPLNDSRTASVTLSAFDPALTALNALSQVPGRVYLKAYYEGTLVFWGPVKTRAGDMAAGTVRLDAVDQSLRLIRHHIRRGDTFIEELTVENQDDSPVPIDHNGLRMLRDAGDTTAFPPTGIADGTNNYPTAAANERISVQRGDEVFQKMRDLSQSLGPDFELEPVDTVPGVYAYLNTYYSQGQDFDQRCVLHYGTGRNTLESLTFTEGERYTNMVHVVDAGHKAKATRYNATALVQTGPYIDFIDTGYEAPASASIDDIETVLGAYADDYIKAYGRPLVAVEATLPPDTPGGYHFGEDYILGCVLEVAGKVGALILAPEFHRVVKVTLTIDADSQVRQGLELVPDRTVDDTISSGDPEEDA